MGAELSETASSEDILAGQDAPLNVSPAVGPHLLQLYLCLSNSLLGVKFLPSLLQTPNGTTVLRQGERYLNLQRLKARYPFAHRAALQSLTALRFTLLLAVPRPANAAALAGAWLRLQERLELEIGLFAEGLRFIIFVLFCVCFCASISWFTRQVQRNGAPLLLSLFRKRDTPCFAGILDTTWRTGLLDVACLMKLGIHGQETGAGKREWSEPVDFIDSSMIAKHACLL